MYGIICEPMLSVWYYVDVFALKKTVDEVLKYLHLISPFRIFLKGVFFFTPNRLKKKYIYIYIYIIISI